MYYFFVLYTQFKVIFTLCHFLPSTLANFFIPVTIYSHLNYLIFLPAISYMIMSVAWSSFWLIQCDVYSITHSQFDVQWSEIRSVKLKMFGILDTKIYNTTSVGTTICKIFSQIINQLLYTSESTLACRHSLFCLKTHTLNLSSSL